MAFNPDFAAQVRELLIGMEPLQIRKMFGSAGLYRDGLMFGLLGEEALYLKVDDETQATFADAGSQPFVFEMKDGRSAALRYWRLPDTAADDPDEALKWARLAFDAALRAKAPKRKKADTREDIGPGPWDG